jgi:hypothetical protein
MKAPLVDELACLLLLLVRRACSSDLTGTCDLIGPGRAKRTGRSGVLDDARSKRATGSDRR